MVRRLDFTRSTPVERVIQILTLISSMALLAMMLTIFTGVVARYYFRAPIVGLNEIVELLSVALVMLAMPYAAQTEAHIRVDIFDNWLGRIGRFVGDIAARAAGIFILSFLSFRAWHKLMDVAEFGDTTNMLRIPLWPFYGVVLVGGVFYVFVLLLQLISILATGPEDE